MKVNMPIGIDNFKKAKEEYYLVDKTRFICQLIDKHAAVTLFTRPRRFGKTLTMSMVEYFFSIDKKDESKTLFQDMDVAKAGTSYMEQRGKYPVVFMTLKDCAELTWEDTYEQLKLFIRKEYKKHPYLLTSNLFSEDEIAAMKRIIMGTASDAEYKCSLGDLSAYLYRYFGTKAIILIDEYDAPIQSAYAHGFYDEAISFFRRWLSIALKGNDSLHFAILTGVLRIAKESVFCGLNNLEVFSVLSTGYGDTFGFTAEEIKHMAQTLGYADKIDEIRY